MSDFEKSCFKCGESKPPSAFYAHPQMADGHVNKCKECNKLDVRLNTERRRDYYNAYDRNRSTLPHRKALDKQKGKSDRSVTWRKSYRYSTKRKAARTAVANAVRDGHMIKLPCWTCGCLDVEGHHPDYDSPLDVIWLCTAHHAEIHRKYDHEQDKEILAATEKGSRWK